MSATTQATHHTVLEFQSPTGAVIAQPIPASGRLTIWVIAAALLSSIGISGFYPIDRVVTVPGKVVAKTPNLVVQPLDTAIVRQIAVQPGQLVHAGDKLAVLDPTFATAEAGASDAQAVSLQAEVDRLEAESQNRPYLGDGGPASQLQAMIYAQRHAEQAAKLETYRQRIEAARAKVAQTTSDINSYAEQYRVAETKEAMRKQLEQMQVGSKLNTLDAGAQRAEVNRALQAAFASHAAAHSDLDGLVAERDEYIQQAKGETARQLTEQGRKLADAREQQAKARLRRALVDLRADRDAVVLNVARVSVGSVVQSGDELITLAPTDAPLEVQTSIPARDAGFVQAGNHAIIKFDTFPYTTYGYATGTLTTVSADSFANPDANQQRPGRPTLGPPEADGAAAFFRGSVSLDAVKLHNLPEGFRMTAGMPVTTDIKVGKRTILSYLLSRAVPTLTEGMREP